MLLAFAAIAVATAPAALAACGGGGGRVDFDPVEDSDADPDWSATANLIAFASGRGVGGIYVVRPDGRGMRRVFRGAATDVDWSPDGRWLAFVGTHGIGVVCRDGRQHRTVLRGNRYSLPASPDGSRIAFQCTGDVCVANADGEGEVRTIATEGGDPSWSPDSTRLVFEHGGTGFFSLRSLSIIGADGKGLRKLTFGEEQRAYRWFSLTPVQKDAYVAAYHECLAEVSAGNYLPDFDAIRAAAESALPGTGWAAANGCLDAVSGKSPLSSPRARSFP